MKIFYTPTFHNECKNLNEEQSSSTLLIPKDLIDFWNRKTSEKEASCRDYLHLLLKKYRFLIYNGILEKSETLMTEYQEEDLNLQKVAIRPYPEFPYCKPTANKTLAKLYSYKFKRVSETKSKF